MGAGLLPFLSRTPHAAVPRFERPPPAGSGRAGARHIRPDGCVTMVRVSLPDDHPHRHQLNDEAHARPFEPMGTPSRITYIAFYTDWSLDERDWRPLADLAERFEALPPRPGANHYFADFGRFRLKWERHTEFTRYTIIAPGAGEDPFADPAVNMLPKDWLENLPGELLVATHAALVHPGDIPNETDTLAARFFNGNVLLGSQIGDGEAVALTDFRIHGDRFGRLLVINRGLSERRAGRMMQRLFEIDTYRLLALMALPIARRQLPTLRALEQDLINITFEMETAAQEDEPKLLDRLTRLQGGIEKGHASSAYRFSAAEAYYQLVNARIEELREQRYPGVQHLREFTERRLAPAVATCRAVAERQDSLSVRAARATQLLSTRVDIDRQAQNQLLLETMSRRAKLQLRLQQTVEGLSVAAITYYVVGLVGYAAKAAEKAGAPINPDVATGLAIPVVILIAAGVIQRVRRKLVGDDADHD
ncbi:hypothetical protein CCR85_07825 [Rhodothalassium salexigens]|nr:hypothetical protein [Rhodothalassium salexigens]MBK5920228.1 hypothetical protein [Rhodothalassium salexigens]